MKTTTLKISAIVLLLLFLFSLSYADDSEAKKADEDISLFYILMPGGTHFYEGDTEEGLAFALPEISLLAVGLSNEDNLEKNVIREVNMPLVMAGQLYAVDKWRYFQKSQIRYRQRHPNDTFIPFDDTPFPQLLSAPFKGDVIKTPFVLTFAALGIADSLISYPKSRRGYSDIDSIHTSGNTMNREAGSAYYESAAFGLSYGAALSEELMFRGLFMPILDYKYGKKVGLISTSLAFGLLHLSNDNIEKPGYFLTQATMAGFALGYNVQQNEYRLSEAIAAHFWYNFVSMTTTWLTNPRKNPLGIRVAFAF